MTAKPASPRATSGGTVAQGSQALRWLIGISLIGLVLVFGVRWFFDHLNASLREQGANERARIFVGEEIVHSIQGIEKNIYLMAATQNAAGFARAYKSIDDQLIKLMHDLNVLKFGGTARRALRLNLTESDEEVREATYHPDPEAQQLVMEVIEIGPQLSQVRDLVDELEALLSQRWEIVQQGDRTRFFLVEEEIALLLKRMPPYFERLDENANRLFLEGDKRLMALEQARQQQRETLKWIETALIGLVIVFGGYAAMLALRRLTAALGEARLARDEIERQNVQNATMLDTLSDGVYATDMDGNITFVNSAAERILGWRTHELEGRSAHASIHHTHPDGRHFPSEECPLWAVLHEGTSLDGEDRFIARDGRFIPVSFRSKPLSRDGVIAGSLVSFQDISDRQESEARIRLQQAALDAAANMITITDRDGVIEYVNPAFCVATGYLAEEVLGKKTNILNSGLQDREFFRALWDTLLAGRIWEGELTNRRKDGSLYQEQMTVTPILANAEISHFIAIKRDITEEARTRTRLKLVETAIQETRQGILITAADADPDGPTIQYVNHGFSQITGFTPEDAVGRRTGLLRDPDAGAGQAKQLARALSEGSAVTLEMNYRRKDGSPYIAEVHYSPVHNDKGQISHFIGLLSDISQRKDVEATLRQAHDQALETSRLKSEFLSTMSHEIRTPMNGIIGMTDLLLDTELDDEQRDFAGIVRDSAHSLLTIINDILDFSKIEAGKLEIESADFSPVQLTEGATALLTAKAREKSLALHSFVDPALPERLRGDPTRLRQVLLNLLGNAVKFTERGEVRISALRVTGNGQDWLRFEIRDTGIGLSPATRSRLFQSFTQADSSTTRKYGGTGLGLAISKRLVELMGGEIGVDSEEAVGSTFWFTLPLVPAMDAMPTHPGALAGRPGSDAYRVLVVDDEPADREILHRYLASWDVRDTLARDGAEALACLADADAAGAPYAIALIDYRMPDMDGIALARAIRADARFDTTRLLLLTAHDHRDLFDDARAAGFAACFVKPIRQSQLLDFLSEHPNAVPPVSETTISAPDRRMALAQHRLILLAEDNPTNQKLARLLLGKLGYAVHVVGNGLEAVEAVETVPYAAVLMDCQMPVMDGYDATLAIRKAEQETGKHVPIIAMTANAMQGDRERCLALGMDDYISKPIKSDQLAEVLARWSGASEPPARAAADATAATAPLRFELLREYCGDDLDAIREILDVFAESTADLLRRMRASLAGRDAAAAKALAHELKGASGNLGLNEMAAAAAALELAAGAADWDRAERESVALDHHLARVRRATKGLEKGTTP
jgi:PAS domain S-box-containing protein